jgi:hypothetical protein
MGKYGMLSRGERVWEIHVLYETKIKNLEEYLIMDGLSEVGNFLT